jgi:hypothetical protein
MLVAGVVLVVALIPSGALAASGLRVRGNHLVYGRGQGRIVQLRGVNRSGTESGCQQGWGVFSSSTPMRPDSAWMIRAMRSWDINVVRVPLNEDCWLGVNVGRHLSGPAYRRRIERYVHKLNRAGLFVILDLHWTAPGHREATGQMPMPDADHSPALWRSVARAFKSDHDLIFDLFNEPFGIHWSCWLNGCSVYSYNGFPAYRAAGMQQLVNAVRSTGATQPLMVGGNVASLDLSQWVADEPKDPRHQLVASEHSYGVQQPCHAACLTAVAGTAQRVPVVMGELGETDCKSGYVRRIMRFDDQHGISYLGWAWDSIASGWSCFGGPSLIKNYAGSPTRFGAGFRSHFRARGVPIRP